MHPLLRGGASNDNASSTKKPEEPVRTPAMPLNIHNTAYGQLIKKYEHLRQRDKYGSCERSASRLDVLVVSQGCEGER